MVGGGGGGGGRGFLGGGCVGNTVSNTLTLAVLYDKMNITTCSTNTSGATRTLNIRARDAIRTIGGTDAAGRTLGGLDGGRAICIVTSTDNTTGGVVMDS